MKSDWQSQSEKQIIDEAKKRADAIIKEAEETARIIYVSSLEYVDDMLAEVELVALRAKESMRIQNETAMGELDSRINLIGEHKQQLLEMLQALSENGQRPMKKASYNIRIDETYLPKKQGYTVKLKGSAGDSSEVHKPAKMPYEIKIADEWKGRVEEMLNESQETLIEEPIPQKIEEEEEEGFKASDFDLDAEYFSWLQEEEQSLEHSTKKSQRKKLKMIKDSK